MFNITRIFGPIVGGAVLAAVGPALCFFVNAVTYIAAIVGLLLMRNMRAAKRASRDESVLLQIGEGVSHVWTNVLSRNMLIMTAVVSAFLAPYMIFIPVYALSIFKVGEVGQAVMMAAVGVGALIAAAAISSLGHRYELTTPAIIGAFLLPVGVFGLAFSGSFYMSLGCLVTVGMGMMTFMASANAIMQTEAPPGLVGRVMSVRALVLFGVGAIGSYLMAKLATVKSLDVRGALLIGAFVGLITFVYFSAAMLRSRKAAALAVPPAIDEAGADPD